MEAIVLAGGFGTRLQSVVSDVPKPMAKIQEKPFLEYILQQLKNNGIQKVILSVGYKYQIIQDYFRDSYNGLDIEYVIEDEPLGTGGAIRECIPLIKHKTFFVVNGDTYFDVDFKKALSSHTSSNADLTLSLKPMKNFDRYGSVDIDQEHRVSGFKEKEFVTKGYINGGIYVLTKDIFKPFNPPIKFSFEEFMQQNVNKLKIYGTISDSYFIDIGIPEDYLRAQTELVNFYE